MELQLKLKLIPAASFGVAICSGGCRYVTWLGNLCLHLLCAALEPETGLHVPAPIQQGRLDPEAAWE